MIHVYEIQKKKKYIIKIKKKIEKASQGTCRINFQQRSTINPYHR